MAEAEIGVMLPQTKDRQGVPGAARSWQKPGRTLPQHPHRTEAGHCSAGLSWALCSGGTCAQGQQRGRGRGITMSTTYRGAGKGAGELISLFVHFFMV